MSEPDEAAITRLLAEHTYGLGVCRCGAGEENYFGLSEHMHRAHVAAVLAAHMADREADAWDAGHEASDCECGHNIFAHPKDNWRDCRARDRCGCTGFEPVRNPFRLTPDTEADA